ncbi:MAG: thymidine phosphorylase [Peptoniphilaceae bacterium]
MNIYDILDNKKNNKSLSEEEIKFFIKNYINNNIKDYQASALLMAICINKLNLDETYYLTKEILESGDKIDLSNINGIKVDKHSTGGVGDTTTLVLGPLVASCGIPFAKMSGRGLGYTGGTLDKLESIPGFNVNLSVKEFIHNANEIKISLMGQTKNITPADKKLYELRDATATVDDPSLIASSIMSKKIAVGADCLVLDVKVGSGAFMKNIEEARKLSKIMVDLGEKFNKKVVALLTNMNQPLGNAIGNSLEVIEAIKTLKGEGPKDLEDLSISLGSKLLLLSGRVNSMSEAEKLLKDNIKNGNALKKFTEFIDKQNGDTSYIKNVSKFSLSPIKKEIYSESEGYVNKLNALGIAEAAKKLGAGREKKEDKIDFGSGVLLNKKIDDYVGEGELLATIYTCKEDMVEEGINLVSKAYQIGLKNNNSYKMILGEVN